jgi:hypothetical protein
MSKTMYSVFDTNGFGVTGQLYYQKANAESFALNAALVAEHGQCHAGIPCADHDELERGLCYHCAAVLPSVPSLSPCEHCHLFASHETFCPNFERVSRIATEYSYTFEATFEDADGYEFPAQTYVAASYLEAYDKARVYACLNRTRVHEVVNVF